jgi:hypothetical protein
MWPYLARAEKDSRGIGTRPAAEIRKRKGKKIAPLRENRASGAVFGKTVISKYSIYIKFNIHFFIIFFFKYK